MALHGRILHNGQIQNAGSPALFAGQVGLLSGWGVFSTLRVAEGVLFAWERHWARMLRDARLLNVAMPPDANAVERDLLRLIEANKANVGPDCTLRLAIVRNTGGMWEGPTSDHRAVDVVALTADSRQWGESVRLSIQADARFSRNEFAGAKILSWGQNLVWAERAGREGFDEAVLLNERGLVAECTSANIFAVFGNEVVTPPLGDGCLPGITREILLREIHFQDVAVRERSLKPDDLYGADEVFITSTTRDLLPVREIAGRELHRQSDVRERLAAEFRQFLQRDIAGRKLTALSV
jgi:branched-chain amino acid aminotransferase